MCAASAVMTVNEPGRGSMGDWGQKQGTFQAEEATFTMFQGDRSVTHLLVLSLIFYGCLGNTDQAQRRDRMWAQRLW